MVQDVFDTHPAIRAACERCILGHSASVERTIAEALKAFQVDAPWTPHSLGMHIQAVLQGAFVLGKATGGGDVAVTCVNHLIDYVETIFKPGKTKP